MYKFTQKPFFAKQFKPMESDSEDNINSYNENFIKELEKELDNKFYEINIIDEGESEDILKRFEIQILCFDDEFHIILPEDWILLVNNKIICLSDREFRNIGEKI